MSRSPITSATLRVIADSLDDLARTSVRVETFTVAGVAVRVRWHDDQRDGAWHEVLEIGDHSDPAVGVSPPVEAIVTGDRPEGP